MVSRGIESPGAATVSPGVTVSAGAASEMVSPGTLSAAACVVSSGGGAGRVNAMVPPPSPTPWMLVMPDTSTWYGTSGTSTPSRITIRVCWGRGSDSSSPVPGACCSVGAVGWSSATAPGAGAPAGSATTVVSSAVGPGGAVESACTPGTLSLVVSTPAMLSWAARARVMLSAIARRYASTSCSCSTAAASMLSTLSEVTIARTSSSGRSGSR